jgi:chitodextrinase
VQIAEVDDPTYRDDPKRGTFTYTVRAVDAAGNLGPLSKPLTADTSNDDDDD